MCINSARFRASPDNLPDFLEFYVIFQCPTGRIEIFIPCRHASSTVATIVFPGVPYPGMFDAGPPRSPTKIVARCTKLIGLAVLLREGYN
jgi:hypothetical protein